MKFSSQLRKALKKLIFEIRIRIYPFLCRYHSWVRKNHRYGAGWRLVDFRKDTHFMSRCICISLTEDPRFEYRRSFFRRYAERFEWPISFWSATNGGNLKEYPSWISKDERPSHSAPLSKGEIGLLVTTKALYKWAFEKKLDFLVVFEDDAAIHMGPLLELPEKFDFVFINNRFSGDPQGHLRTGWGADGYIISRDGILKMLNIMETEVNEPIDLLIMMYARSLETYKHYITHFRNPSLPQLECFHIGPVVTHADFFDSTIRLVSNA